MNLKYKFLSAFVPLFTISLTFLTIIAVSLFVKDKIAYVFSSIQDGSQMASLIVQNQIQAQDPLMEMLISSFDFGRKVFPEKSKALLQLTEHVALINVDEINNGKAKHLDALGTWPPELANWQQSTGASGQATELIFFKENPNLWGLVRTVSIKGYNPETYRLTVLFKNNPLKGLFARPRYYDLFMVSKSGDFFMKSAEMNDASSESKAQSFIKEYLKIKDSSLSQEINSYLFTWSPIAGTDYGIVSVTQKSKVTEAIESMKRTSMGILCILLAVGLTVVLLLIRNLTKNIESLTKDLQRFSSGDLKTKSNIKTKDEVGLMSKVFNQMTTQIEELIIQTASKARLESELNTARRVQQLYIPSKDYLSEKIEICGYCESATECGGDWWSYDIHEDFCRLIIADVTGHGVGPAMLTSALHAAVISFRELKDLSLAQFVKNLNQVICSIARGELVLTMFVAEINFKTGKLVYVNASHNAAILLRANQEMDFLTTMGGPHLGRSLDSKFVSDTIDINPGDQFIAYTDGLTEFSNENGRMFGEKKLAKILATPLPPEKSQLSDLRENLLKEFTSFRRLQELPDDVTIVMAKIPEVEEKNQEASPA